MIVALTAIALLSAVSASAILAAGHLTTIRAGNLVVQAEGAISPNSLPKNRMAPISVHASGSVTTANGSHVPPAQTVSLQVDKHIRIETTGLATCTPARIAASSPAQAIKACREALVGRGSVAAQVEFPESIPFNAKGPLLIFNGPTVRGYPEMFFYAYVNVPAPTAIVATAKLTKDSGKYGFTIALTIPRVAGGSGSLTGFELTANRKWTYKGRQYSYLNADCPDGHFLDQVEATFGDGTNLSGILANSCRSKG